MGHLLGRYDRTCKSCENRKAKGHTDECPPRCHWVHRDGKLFCQKGLHEVTVDGGKCLACLADWKEKNKSEPAPPKPKPTTKVCARGHTYIFTGKGCDVCTKEAKRRSNDRNNKKNAAVNAASTRERRTLEGHTNECSPKCRRKHIEGVTYCQSGRHVWQENWTDACEECALETRRRWQRRNRGWERADEQGRLLVKPGHLPSCHARCTLVHGPDGELWCSKGLHRMDDPENVQPSENGNGVCLACRAHNSEEWRVRSLQEASIFGAWGLMRALGLDEET